jgi:hypothetical protein
MIFLLFGMSESGEKMEGKINMYLINDINNLTLIGR